MIIAQLKVDAFYEDHTLKKDFCTFVYIFRIVDYWIQVSFNLNFDLKAERSEIQTRILDLKYEHLNISFSPMKI